MIPLRDTQPSYSTPFVTLAIIIVNVMVFLHQVSLDSYELNHFIARYAIVPDRFQYIDLLTATFMHGGWMHLIGNMWFLWIYGDNVEDVLGHGGQDDLVQAALGDQEKLLSGNAALMRKLPQPKSDVVTNVPGN